MTSFDPNFRGLRRLSRHLLSAVALTLAAMAGAAPIGLMAERAAAAETPVRGGSMTIINGSDINSWDPAITNATYPGGPMDALDAVYGVLVYVDVKGDVVGSMAQSLSSTDAIHWTLKLRSGTKFTDGNPYDAAAVKFNWDREADPAAHAPAQAFVASWNKSITIVDPLTLSVTLASPNANFGRQIAQLAPFVASPAALKAATRPTDIKPIGAGPFALTNWNQGVSMTFARNPGYWDQPRPYLDTLKFAIIPETNSRIATVVQGGATMMAGYPYQFGNNATARGVAALEIPIRGINRAYFNQVSGTFTDVRAREAFYAGIDRTRLMRAFTQTDLYTAPVSYFGTSSPYFDPSLTLPKYDPAKAQQLIDALKADGKPFNVKIVTYPNSDLKRLTGYIQQALSQFQGATVSIVEVDQALLPDRCKAETNDICFEGGVLVSNGVEPDISDLLRTNGATNWGRYSNPAMDAALTEGSSTVDPAAAKAAYVKVQQIIVHDLPIYIFGEQTRSLLLRNNTGGVVPSDGGMLQKQFLYVCPDVCVK